MKRISKKTIINRIKVGKHCCPICGCAKSWSTGNMAEYPERWENSFCSKCGQMVCVSDNSPYYHICEDILQNVKLLSVKNIIKFVRSTENNWQRTF